MRWDTNMPTNTAPMIERTETTMSAMMNTRNDPARHDSDLDGNEDADDQEPEEDPPGKPHGIVPLGGITCVKFSGRVIRTTVSFLSFSKGKVKTMTVRSCESVSRRALTLYSK